MAMAVRASKSITSEEYQLILHLRRNKTSIKMIAEKLGRAKSTIQYILHKGHNPVGRPSKYSEEIIKRIFHLRSQGISLKETGDYLGLSDASVRKYINQYNEQMDNQRRD